MNSPFTANRAGEIIIRITSPKLAGPFFLRVLRYTINQQSQCAHIFQEQGFTKMANQLFNTYLYSYVVNYLKNSNLNPFEITNKFEEFQTNLLEKITNLCETKGLISRRIETYNQNTYQILSLILPNNNYENFFAIPITDSNGKQFPHVKLIPSDEIIKRYPDISPIPKNNHGNHLTKKLYVIQEI